MSNIRMLYHQDHIWMFYSCGNAFFFNHESRQARLETERTVNFTFATAQTMVGGMYCDGFGRMIPGIPESGVRSYGAASTLEGLSLAYIAHGSTHVLERHYRGSPGEMADARRWSAPVPVRNQRGALVQAQDLSTFEFQGQAHLLLRQSARQIAYRGRDQEWSTITLAHDSNLNIPLQATVLRSSRSNRLVIVTAANDGQQLYQLTILNLDQDNPLQNMQQTELKWFYPATRASNLTLTAHLNGKLKLYYLEGGERYETTLDIHRLTQLDFAPHSGHSMAFNERSESMPYGVFELPLACHPSKGCMLLAISYPQSARFVLGGPARLLHPLYAGKVVARAYSALPLLQQKMEVIGIIEGPPPIPTNNLLASLKVVPAAFVLDAARGLSRFIKTNIAQELRFQRLKQNEHIQTTTYGVTLTGGAATITPIQMSLMNSVGKKLGSLEEQETSIAIKKTFSNEIQSTARNNGKVLEMLPIGKLVMMKYDIRAIQYVFLNEQGAEVEDGPVIFSLAKTNIRPVIRPYEILGRKLKPQKYPYGIIVGDLGTYASFQRRHSLIEQAGALAPNHPYLSFTYNNMLDLESNVAIAHSHRQRVSSTDIFTIEGGLGGQWQKLVGMQLNFKNEEERTYALQDVRGEATSINVEMNYVQPTNDTRVRHYDFEVYYLLPSQNHLRDLIEELQDTASASRLNRELLAEIKDQGAPWKVTYSVSDIRIPYR